jgi:hypothetical protein
MKYRSLLTFVLASFLHGCAAYAAPSEKVRLFVLTDIENEPDDAQSMVRLLTYSNQFDIEGLVATTSVHMSEKTSPARIHEIVDAYGQVRDNLEKHESGWPSVEHLHAVISEGLPQHGMRAVGEGKDSPGSAALAKFVAKLRVYTISDQDDSGPWIRKNFPNLFYIVSPGYAPGGAYHFATWSGISGDKVHGRFTGADFSIVDNSWLDQNIRRKGPLGAQHPRTLFLMEGDTPSFLGLVNNGLNEPEQPNWGGWGGRYELYLPPTQRWYLEPETRPIWTNAVDEVLGTDGHWHTTNHATIWRWRFAFQNDFAARMDWTVKPPEEANHPPVPRLGHARELTSKQGMRVDLNAEGSSDPDGDTLSYRWLYYPEAGTFTVSGRDSGELVGIKSFDQPKAWFTVPTSRVMPPGTGTMHIILAVTDHGTPRLTRYQRVIVTVMP